MSLPNWPGAAVCYTRAYDLLERMAQAGHVTRQKTRRYGPICTVSDDMARLIKALDNGDENVIKGMLLARIAP